MTTEATSLTIRFSSTMGMRLASERMAASDIRDELRIAPSTCDASRSNADRSVDSDSWVSSSSTVKPRSCAARSAPRIIPKKTGLAMSATTTTRIPVPRSDTRRSIWPVR